VPSASQVAREGGDVVGAEALRHLEDGLLLVAQREVHVLLPDAELNAW
jgi:hypothetical protein